MKRLDGREIQVSREKGNYGTLRSGLVVEIKAPKDSQDYHVFR